MYLILTLFAYAVSYTPAALLQGFSFFLSILLFDIFKVRRKIVLKNLDIAFSDQLTPLQKTNIARLSYYHFCLTFFETLESVRKPIDRHITIKGGEFAKEALSKGKGAYFLCAHFGNWEAMPSVVNKYFAAPYIITKPIGSPSVNRFIEDIRAKNGFHIIERKQKGDGFKGIKDALKRRQIVGFIFDQTRPGEPKLDFFGSPAKTNTSLAAIWQKCPAPIVPISIKRTSFAHHEVQFQPEVDASKLFEEGKINEMSTYFNSIVEGMVRQAPEQYFWMHNRWK